MHCILAELRAGPLALYVGVHFTVHALTNALEQAGNVVMRESYINAVP